MRSALVGTAWPLRFDRNPHARDKHEDKDTTGPSEIYPIVYALDGFSSDEGYETLRQRFESAAKSWASVSEAQSLYRLIARILHHGQVQRPSLGPQESPRAIDSAHSSAQSDESTDTGSTGRVNGQSSILSAFHEMTGDVSQIYGLANMDALSVKRPRFLFVRI